MSSAQDTLPVPGAQVLPGRTVLHSNPTPRNRQESFVRKRRASSFFHDICGDDDTDPLPEEDHSEARDMRVVEFDERVMAHEWTPVPVAEMPQEPQQPVVKIDYFKRYPQHQGKLPPISEHPLFG